MGRVLDLESKQRSLWHRWDPHLHTPGTALNNQYRGANPREDFLKAIETSEPRRRQRSISICSSRRKIQIMSSRLSASCLSSIFHTKVARTAVTSPHNLEYALDARNRSSVSRRLTLPFCEADFADAALEQAIGTPPLRPLSRLGCFAWPDRKSVV